MKRPRNISLLLICIAMLTFVVVLLVFRRGLALNGYDKPTYTETTKDYTVTFSTIQAGARVKFAKDGYEITYTEPLNDPDWRRKTVLMYLQTALHRHSLFIMLPRTG